MLTGRKCCKRRKKKDPFSWPFSLFSPLLSIVHLAKNTTTFPSCSDADALLLLLLLIYASYKTTDSLGFIFFFSLFVHLPSLGKASSRFSSSSLSRWWPPFIFRSLVVARALEWCQGRYHIYIKSEHLWRIDIQNDSDWLASLCFLVACLLRQPNTRYASTRCR